MCVCITVYSYAVNLIFSSGTCEVTIFSIIFMKSRQIYSWQQIMFSSAYILVTYCLPTSTSAVEVGFSMHIYHQEQKVKTRDQYIVKTTKLTRTYLNDLYLNFPVKYIICNLSYVEGSFKASHHSHGRTKASV